MLALDLHHAMQRQISVRMQPLAEGNEAVQDSCHCSFLRAQIPASQVWPLFSFSVKSVRCAVCNPVRNVANGCQALIAPQSELQGSA